jgi:hypothetical protein
LVTQNFWRDNCGFNNFYPQNGTWIYDRAGWCPGDLVHGYSHVLTGVTANSNYNLNVTFPAYNSNPSSSGSKASYIIESSVIYYAGFNKTLDASLDDVIAPSKAEAHFRSNPHTGDPIIRVANTGSSAITSIKFEYGLVGGNQSQYTWTGSIASLKDTLISLPDITELKNATGANTFIAKILEVNGQTDVDLTNNSLTSDFTAAPAWPTVIRISFRTNNSTDFGGASESSYKIYDANNNIVAQRVNNAPATTFIDTIALGFGSYRLVVEDAGCDGLSWWANPSGGTGHVQVRSMISNIPFPMNGYYSGDFGCGYTQYFTSNWPTGVANISSATKEASIDAYPNPAQRSVTVSLGGINKVSGDISIVDALGRVVLTQPCISAVQYINTSSLSNGVYTVVYTDNSGKLQTRLLIAK